MALKYQSPPINELVIAAYFKEPLSQLRAEHIGLYWSLIRQDFPKSNQNMVIGNVDLQAPNELFPLPRFWFISEDDTLVIQIQRNAFLFNWRKVGHSYPHYNNLKLRFDVQFEIFISFVRNIFAAEPRIERCELNYINIIDDVDYYRSVSDVGSVIPSFSSPAVAGSELNAFNASYNYSVDEDCALTLIFQSRTSKSRGTPVLYFELRGSGAVRGGTKLEADAWYSKAHTLIGETFVSITNPNVQHRFWRPVGA